MNMEITECKWLAHNGQKPDEEEMLGGAVVVNDEYKQIDWQVKNPENRISTIHAFCVHPDFWGKGTRKFWMLEYVF